ncbi:MAG: NAD(P)/FAD-dependent oxidoreductase [Steroidobacteraceae bacterium]
MTPDPSKDTDALIVGAGAVGLACGYALAQAGLRVIVLEAGPRIGEGVSARNSEVIHAGLYYPTDSLKARLCIKGRRALYPFLESHGVSYRRCGKLVVGNGDAEIAALKKVWTQAEHNGVEGIEWLSGAEARQLEPQLRCDAALLSKESGILDSHGYMLALQGEIEAREGHVVCDSPFAAAAPLADGSAHRVDAHGVRRNGGTQGWSVTLADIDRTTLTTSYLVTAAGLDAQEVATRIEGFPTARIPPRHLGKGVYFRYTGKAPFQRLVYPPPIPGALGTHYRLDLGGQGVLGPDLEYVEEIDYSVDPAKAQRFYEDVRRYWPTLESGSLQPDYAGIRPKIHGPGEPQPDFRIDGPAAHGLPGLVTLFGIESPGLTSSLAIGEQVRSLLESNKPGY